MNASSHPSGSSRPADLPAEAVPLAALRGGECGRLHMSQLACDDCDLLNAMGLTDQCEIRVCRRGEPYIVQVSTTRLGLSAKLAERIYITRSATPEKKAS